MKKWFLTKMTEIRPIDPLKQFWLVDQRVEAFIQVLYIKFVPFTHYGFKHNLISYYLSETIHL